MEKREIDSGQKIVKLGNALKVQQTLSCGSIEDLGVSPIVLKQNNSFVSYKGQQKANSANSLQNITSSLSNIPDTKAQSANSLQHISSSINNIPDTKTLSANDVDNFEKS